MKIMVLSDSKAMDGFGAEHGLSFLVEIDKKRFLFDTGASDLFLKNAQKLGIDPGTVDAVVLSHGHFDHGDGLQYLEGNTLVCHPDCFVDRYRKQGFGNLGVAVPIAEIRIRFNLITSREPFRLSEHLFFLGEIPRNNDFEAKSTKYILKDGSDDYIMDDSGLACITEKGLVVVSGCAHSGICNMVEHARRVTGIDRVEGVIGGFHLKDINDQTLRTIGYLQKIGVKRVLPSHCTMDPALKRFFHDFGSNEVTAGSTIEF